MVLQLVRGSEQPPHSDPSHYVPTQRPGEAGRLAPGAMVPVHTLAYGSLEQNQKESGPCFCCSLLQSVSLLLHAAERFKTL